LKRIQAALSVAVPSFEQLRFKKDEMGRPHVEARYKHFRPNAGWQTEEQFSDGTLRLIGLLWSLLEGNSMLLLEEPEISLNDAIVEQRRMAGDDIGGAGGVDAVGDEEIVVLNAVSYISDAAAAAAVAASVTTNGLAMVIVYHNSTTGEVHVIHTTNSDTGAGVSLIATMDNVAGLAATVAGNFGGRP
jgi:hypothetical protein